MTLPPLYLEGLSQKARQGQHHLDAHKVGLVEAILRDGLRGDADAVRLAAETALAVASWDPPRPPREENGGRR